VRREKQGRGGRRCQEGAGARRAEAVAPALSWRPRFAMYGPRIDRRGSPGGLHPESEQEFEAHSHLLGIGETRPIAAAAAGRARREQG